MYCVYTNMPLVKAVILILQPDTPFLINCIDFRFSKIIRNFTLVLLKSFLKRFCVTKSYKKVLAKISFDYDSWGRQNLISNYETHNSNKEK